MNALKLKGSSFVYGYTTVSSNTGTSISYAQEKGIPAYTLELSYNIDSTGLYSDFTIGRGAEALAAFLRQFTIENKFTPAFVPDPFIVTLTPDAQDLSGSMDKTPEEITAAYVAGREIRIAVPALGGITGICTEFAPQENGNIMLWCNFVAHLSDLGGWVLITIITNSSNSIYSTTVFPLTPMS